MNSIDALFTMAGRADSSTAAVRLSGPHSRAQADQIRGVPPLFAMLKRELYKGERIWNKSEFRKVPGTNKRRRKMCDESEWIRTQRPELAIVFEELWDRVQARLNFFGAKPSQGRRRGLLARSLTSPYLFSGTVTAARGD